ncbi:MAG: hypothetical protein AB1432_11035 [Bacteroidota bacterium]|jgi:hypothetical protein
MLNQLNSPSQIDSSAFVIWSSNNKPKKKIILILMGRKIRIDRNEIEGLKQSGSSGSQLSPPP